MLMRTTITTVTDCFKRRPARPVILANDNEDLVSILFPFLSTMLSRGVIHRVAFVRQNKKNRHRISVAGFTIRSLTPLVTTLGCQFVASTHGRPRRLDADRARSVPRSATPCNGTLAATLFLSWEIRTGTKNRIAT